MATICSDFVRLRNKKHGRYIEAYPLVYGNMTPEDPMRQIDQVVVLYSEFKIDEYTSVQLHMRVLIEAKARKNAQVIGIPINRRGYRPQVPLTGFLQGTTLANVLFQYVPFKSYDLVEPVIMVFKDDGTTPEKVSEENVVFNAASSIYDFIRFDSRDIDNGTYFDDVFRKMRIFGRFAAYLKRTNYDWMVVRDWMREKISDDLAREFRERAVPKQMVFGLTAHVPVLCVGGAMWVYQPGKFDSATALLSGVRPASWPGRLRTYLIRYTAEAPILMTNCEGLPGVLSDAYRWFAVIEDQLKTAPASSLLRWPIESELYRAVVDSYLPNYPSGIDDYDMLAQL